MDKRLERILPRVQKPARYTGGEYNQILKDKEKVDLRVAFCFPDTYEIGMSNLGMSILYHTMNSLDYVWCERVFAPWGDMYREMQRAGLPLYALESGDSLDSFDALAFSIGYEMAYTTVLDMIHQAGLPLRSAERTALLPLVFAGGSAAVNAEPMADFIDLFVIGEGEEMNNELLALLRTAKREGWSKSVFLRKAAQIGGVYVPSLYEIAYNDDGTVASITARDGAPEKVAKRIIVDLDSAPYPTNPVVPSTEVVHDRVNLELFRGCVRGCRFCQAGYIYRPIRAKKPETLVRQGVEALRNTGHEDVTLLSLSTSDYRPLPGLCDGLLDYCESRSIGLSLPSLRADNFSMEIMEKLQKVRKRPDLRRGGREPAPARRDQQERHRGGSAAHLRHRLRRRVEHGQALLYAGPAHRDGRGHRRHRGHGGAHPALLARKREEQEPGREDHGLHLLLHPEAPQPLPVGGADHPRGVPAPCQPPAREHQLEKRRLQLARRGHQRGGGRALPRGPAARPGAGGSLEKRRAARGLERLFPL